MHITPKSTTFVLLSFEGPDVYSQAGGLGVRMKGLSRTLAQLGYETHLFFCGDPDLPSVEILESGRLSYHRWCQWISAHHRDGVYDGEEDKLRDWNLSLPAAVVDDLIAPALAAGRGVVVMGEEWQTATSMNLISDSLYYRGLRDRVVMLWNANNMFGFNRINWGALSFASTITTVSRYMKFRMWEQGQNPVVIPNGIPRSSIVDPDPTAVEDVRAAAAADHFCFKIGRFDPDKRWIMAVAALGHLRLAGRKVRLLMRGGREPHGVEVLLFARAQGLEVADVRTPDTASGLAEALRAHPTADVVNLTSFVSDELVALAYASADAVLANSGHEPFGLVGLEVMAAGGLAVTGSTGEDYADGLRNALVLETDDPIELVTMLRLIKDRPALATSIRKRGRATARDYVWENVVDQLLMRIEFAAAQQAVRLAAADRPTTRPASRARPRAKTGASRRVSRRVEPLP
jgi:glycosyltransferase involved in cell wall biosynthesis